LEITSEQYESWKIQFKRIFYYYKSIDHNDVLNDYIVARLEGKSQFQTLKQFSIDYLRTNYTPRKGCSIEYMNNKTSVLNSLDIHDLIWSDTPFVTYDAHIEAKELLSKLDEYPGNEEHKKMFIMHYVFGFDHTEIAEIFNLSISRICKIVTKVREFYLYSNFKKSLF